MTWRDLFPRPEQRALLLIRAAAWLAPSAVRENWRREWLAELHFALRTMRERGEGANADSKAIEFARGAFQDAAWHRLRPWNREGIEQAFSRAAQSAGFCLAALCGLVLAIALASGFLPETRAVAFSLPYPDPGRIATVTLGGPAISLRSGVRREWVRWWRKDSHLLDGAATYLWSDESVDGARTLQAKVSDDFFSVLRGDDPFHGCRDCAVLSYDFAHRGYGQNVPEQVAIGGRKVRVAGILDRRFWFLSRRIGVWVMERKDENPNAKTGVVVRLRPHVSKAQIEAELGAVARGRGIDPWSSLVEISPLEVRVRSVFGSFTLALLLAIGMILPALRSNLRTQDAIRWRGALLRSLFFCAKSALLVLAVLLAGLEFTHATSITMLGGTGLAAEPISTWLFLLGCAGALSWSIHDQRRRCRVCLRRYGLVAQIGCPGCILLSWAGTELVCLEGHGMLHVAERVTCWQDPQRWMSIDDSLLELFANE